MMESSTIEGVHTSMNTSRSPTSSSVLKKSTTANLSTHGTDINASHTSLGSASQRVRIKRKHLKERSSPFEGGQRSPREDTENIPPALPATLPKDYEEIAQRLAGSIHSRVKDVPHRTGSTSVEVPDIHTTDTSRFDPGKHSLDPKLSGKSSVPSEREPGQIPFRLKQGQATHRDVYSHPVDSHSDVRVTQFAAGQKRKVMKESLSKRSEQMGPVRRVFEPHYVATSSSDKTKVVTHERDEISQMAASTAAAVAATAPLIKYQYDLENKVSLILEKLQHLESASVRSKYRGQDPEVAAEQLQRRLDELAQVKLKELEKLQFQHQHIEGHFKHPHPSSSPERPDDKGKEVRKKEHVSSGIRKEKLTPDANPLRTAPERGMTVASRSPQGGELPMGYPEPLSDSSQPARMIGQPLQGTKHVRYAPAVHLHKRPQDDMYEHSANVDPWKGEIPDSKEGILGTKSSPLDTPAPRKYAPVPHSKSTRTRLNGGLLEEILSSQGEAIRQKSPDRSYVEESSPPSQNPTLEGRGVYHSQVEKQADSLLTDIASLRKDISKKIKGRQSPQATSSKSPKRFSLEPSSLAMFQNQPQIVTPETRKDAERELQKWQEKRLAPPPLDEYMRKPYHPPTVTTPPSRPIHTSNLADTHVLTSGAPVQPSSAIIQAETLLKRVQTSRKYLESNLEVIQRSKREQEFQEVMESMYADGDAAERTQIKLLVDDYITLVDSQVKEELRHYRSNLAFSPPTKLPPDKHQKPLAAETSKTSKPAKKKVSAKIDTGLRKPKETGDGKPIKDIIATGNETREKPKEKKSVTKKVSSVSTKFPVKDYQDNRYLSSIYGRNLLQQSQRTTLRDAPYLRIANKSPQTKRQRMSPKKDANKNTTQTQTPGGTTEKKVSLLQQFPSHTLPSGSKQSQSYTFQNYLDSPEILRETAIPLGEPRVGGERTEPMVIFNQLDIPPSNKLKQNNVAVISMVTQKPQLEIKHLPPVDIDTEISSISEDQGVPVHRPPQIEEIKAQDLLADQYQEQKEQDADSDKDDIPESSDVLSFQGYRDYPGEYHGPPFPPQTPHQHLERRSEDIAADLERKGLLEHRAMEWIEQELMARMISEFHSRLSRPEERTDSPESDKRHPVDAIGSGGLQLFVDVGQPVNPGLVSSLVKEVLEEDIAKMLGQHLRNLSGEDTNIPATDQRPHSVAEEVSHHELVHTPEVTPSHSPFRSPSPVLHEGQIKTPEPTASDISQEAEPESETTPEETDNLIQAPTSPVGTPPMTPPLSKGALTPEPGHVETPPPSFHEDRPLLLEDTGTVGTPSLTIEESPPVSPDEVKETPQQSPIPPLSLEPEGTPSPTLPPSPQREVTPPPSTQSSSSSTTEDITATETSGREISAGEWLISQQSVGEVPKVLMQGTFLDGTSLQDGGEASQTTSSDTLVETEELENEVAQDQEEGEIRGDVQLDDIRDPMVAILSKLNQLPGAYHLPAQVAQGITQGDPSSSPGEISEGQRPVVAPGVEAHLKRIGAGDDRNLPQSPGEVNLPKEGDIYNREPGETPRIIAQGKTELTHKDSTLRLSQLNSKSSSSDNSEKRSAKDGKRGTLSSDEGRGGEREPVLGLQIAAPRIIQVGSHQSPREEESPKQTEPAGGRQPNLDLFGTHTMSDRDVRPRTLTPDAINMEALLQSGYLSQTFSQSDGGPPMGSLLGQRGTLGGNESGGTLRQTGGALGTTFGTTMTEDSLEVAAAKRVPEEPQQKKVSITLPSTSNIEEEKLDWSQTESEVGNQTVSDVSEISAGDL